MNSNWKPCKLKDIIGIKHGYAFKGAFFSDVPNENLVLTPGNFKIGGGFKYSKGKYYTAEYPAEYKLKAGDVIVTMTDLSKAGDTLGYSAKIPKSNINLLHNQRLGLVEVTRPDDVDLDFIHWLLRMPEYQRFIVGGATGSTVRHTSPSRILEYEFELPPLNEQLDIAATLSGLDNKIEVQELVNSTLESIAQTLFKSWFVDFDPVRAKVAAKANGEDLQLAAMQTISGKTAEELDNLTAEKRKKLAATADLFPDELIETERDKIPKGWEWKNLEEVTSLIIDHRGKTPKKLGGDWVDVGYPAISAKNIKGGKLIRPDMIRYVNEEMYANWMKAPLQQGDIIMTSEAPMGELFFLAENTPYCLSQRLFGIRANGAQATPIYLYRWLHSDLAKNDLEGRLTGTTVTGIKQSELRKVKVLSPSINVLEEFENRMEPLFFQINNLNHQNVMLSQIRDSLIPKLLTGELNIAN